MPPWGFSKSQESFDEGLVDDAGADGEGEREDSGGGGDFALEQLAPAEDEVGTDAIEPGDDAGVAALFAQAEQGAEGAAHFGESLPECRIRVARSNSSGFCN